jgi:coproporphyrinogen III oxidase
MGAPDPAAAGAYLQELQDRIASAFEALDGRGRFREERVAGAAGALARPRVLEDGAVIEKAAVHFTHALGPALPPAATERRPALAGRPFEAVSLSLIVHPRNPFVPTTHMNLRAFAAGRPDEERVWWIGGGFDLTPTYGFEEDCVHWHRTARAACAPLGPDAYPRFKKECDAYFFLPHRGEARGIGGLFFDDLDAGGWERSFAFLRSVGDHFLPAWEPIAARRKDTPFGEREREFQLLRRGRYVEFNLVYDRGTRYGLQSGRRVESVLASLPPLVRWRADWRPEPGSPEARLAEYFLKPRDWLAGEP